MYCTQLLISGYVNVCKDQVLLLMNSCLYHPSSVASPPSLSLTHFLVIIFHFVYYLTQFLKLWAYSIGSFFHFSNFLVVGLLINFHLSTFYFLSTWSSPLFYLMIITFYLFHASYLLAYLHNHTCLNWLSPMSLHMITGFYSLKSLYNKQGDRVGCSIGNKVSI
jgi:hypothetical protein